MDNYIKGVSRGVIPAGKYIKLACQRHVADMNNPEIYFDKQSASRVINFFHTFLVHSKGEWAGKAFSLLPWQIFILSQIFGWKQKKDNTRRFRTAYIEVPRKNGKALALGTPIPTEEGWTCIGDLKEGDRVFNEHGTLCNIVAVGETMLNRPCYNIVFSDGTSIVADENHEWITTARVDTIGKRSRVGIKHGESIIKRIRTTLEIKNTLRYGKRKDINHSIDIAQPLQLAPKKLPIPPYVLGAWLGDGHSRSSRITITEKQICEQIESEGIYLKSYKTPLLYLLGNGSRKKVDRDISTQSKLRELGVLNNKHIPSIYLRASYVQRMALLQGLMDTDGHVSKRGQCEITTIYPNLLDSILELLRGLGYKPSVKTQIARCNGKDCGECYRIQFFGFSDNPVARLPRKVNRLKDIPKTNPRSRSRQIVSVEKIKSVPVRCIQVDNPSGLFLAGDGMIITHNSTISAGVGLYLFIADGEQGAEVYSCATKKDQAIITHSEATRMVKASGELKKLVGIFKNNLHIEATNSKYEPLGADADTMDGLNVHGVVIDELHAHKTRAMWDVMDTATGARRQPLLFAITTAGSDRQSVCWEQHEYATKILKGVIKDDTFFAFLACMDIKEAEEDVEDDWASETTWQKANPSYGVSVKPDDLRRKCAKAKESPASQNAFLRLHLNRWTQQTDRWISIAVWDDNLKKDITESDLYGKTCYGGLDLSSVSDMTAWVMAFPDDDGNIDIVARFWCPEDRLYEESNRYKDQYQVWHRQGFLETTPGNAIDYEFIKAKILEDAERFALVDLNMDRLFQAHQLGMQLQDEGLEVIGMGQGFTSMAAPMKEFERRLLARKLNHGGNPVLRWMADNVAVSQDPAGNIKPNKAESQGKIDGIVALVMAIDRVARNTNAGSVYNERGLLTL